LVQEVEAESRFGIMQLSRTYEITPVVAEVLAEFRGEMLILGLKSLSPEVAAALAKSQAANVWLHSVTSVSPEAAEAIVKLPRPSGADQLGGTRFGAPGRETRRPTGCPIVSLPDNRSRRRSRRRWPRTSEA
jgi:hypothetical protein